MLILIQKPFDTSAQSWVIIHHEAQKPGDETYTKCMPLSAWNAHENHVGDWMGESCTPDTPEPSITATNTDIPYATSTKENTVIPIVTNTEINTLVPPYNTPTWSPTATETITVTYKPYIPTNIPLYPTSTLITQTCTLVSIYQIKPTCNLCDGIWALQTIAAAQSTIAVNSNNK